MTNVAPSSSATENCWLKGVTLMETGFQLFAFLPILHRQEVVCDCDGLFLLNPHSGEKLVRQGAVFNSFCHLVCVSCLMVKNW